MGSRKKNLAILFAAGLLFSSGCMAQKSPANAPTAGSLTPTQPMLETRAIHSATRLANHDVLIAGGFLRNGTALASAEIFDPRTRSFRRVPNMTIARYGHTATLLSNGKVLIAGGFNGNYLDSVEIYDPSTDRFENAGRMTTARSGHTAVLLNAGSVLIVGGTGSGWSFLETAEIYDPETGRFTRTGSMSIARDSHTASLLNDGRVLIAGGHRGRRTEMAIHRTAEIYDPAKRTFTVVGEMTAKRHKHDAVLLADGRVLIIGGTDERDALGAYKNVEVFHPSSGTFSPIAQDMKLARYKLQGTSIRLNDGRVLIAGGSDRAEIYDPKNNSFTLAAGDLGTVRMFATATLLSGGEVLIVGGYDRDIAPTNSAQLYKT